MSKEKRLENLGKTKTVETLGRAACGKEGCKKRVTRRKKEVSEGKKKN